MKLVIVESGAKIKSIEKFLGEDYKVIASTGHIRELKKKPGYGFNRDTLEPCWELVPKPKFKDNLEHTVAEIRAHAKEADIVYLATDPDREGEAISWHIWDILDDSSKAKCKRITFNEITKNAITNAIKSPRDIDMNLVESQFGRRYLDRVVGYDLSNLVKSKLRAQSAGRVQSVALLFIVERYKEIQKFVPKFWWTIESTLKSKNDIPVYLRKIDDPSIKQYGTDKENDGKDFKFITEEDANKILAKLGKDYTLYAIDEPKIEQIKSYVPFTTDSLLSTAFNKLHWSTQKITSLANELYSGVEIDGTMTALISYPRTDTNRLNKAFIADLREYIKNEFGEEYVNHNVKEAQGGDLVQGAHEGIRPIDINLTPEKLKGRIKAKNPKESNDAWQLYTLIWNFTVASFMNPPKYKRHILRFENNNQKFYTSYLRLFFEGYFVLPSWDKSKMDSKIDLSYLKVGDVLQEQEPAKVVKHQTEPPALFNEGSLVKALKEEGVGRPSTYGTMIKIVKDRDYAIVNKNKKLEPTEKGILLIDNLVKECSEVISKKYTAKMEQQLDQIAEGNENWKEWFRAFYTRFKKVYDDAKQNMQKVAPRVFEGKKCPKCGGDLIYKEKRSDKTQFLGCVNFSRDGNGCSYTESLGKEKPKPQMLDEKCPECGSQLIKRYNKRGQEFIGCTGYISNGCKYIRSVEKPKGKAKKAKEDSEE